MKSGCGMRLLMVLSSINTPSCVVRLSSAFRRVSSAWRICIEVLSEKAITDKEGAMPVYAQRAFFFKSQAIIQAWL